MSFNSSFSRQLVLNLIITGMPSILVILTSPKIMHLCFKPYYKWNTFNTIGTLTVLEMLLSFKPNSTGFLKCSNWSHK